MLKVVNVNQNDNNSYEPVVTGIWIANMLVCDVFFLKVYCSVYASKYVTGKVLPDTVLAFLQIG